MEPIKRIESRTVVIPDEDVDTDQIIPARFLTTTERTGLGAHLFHDWRFDDDGQPRPGFVLNTSAADGCEILVAGNNFGCGSSREHAPWALTDFGFRAVVSSRIADIFRSNALKNGLVPVVVDTDTHRRLLGEPGLDVVVDVESCTLTLPDGTVAGFELDEFARHCLMQGVDQLGYLLSHEADIARYEETLQ